MKYRTFLCLLMALSLLCGALSACSKPADGPIVARAGKMDVTYQEYYDLLGSYCARYSITPEQLDAYVGVEQANALREAVASELATEKLMLQKAKELGLDTLTDEQTAQVQESTRLFLQTMLDSFVTEVQAEADAGTLAVDDVQAEAQARCDTYLMELGYTEEYITEYYTHTIVLDRVYAHFTADTAATEEEARTYYDALLTEQRKLFATDPALACYNYYSGLNDLDVYLPDCARRVKHVLIGISDEDQKVLNTITDDAAYQTQYEACLAELLPTAQKALSELQAGTAFEVVLQKYNTDPGMTQEPYASEGYTVYPGASYDPAFLQAALDMTQVGGYSEPVASSFGYHILWYVADVPGGAVAYEAVQQKVQQLATVQKQDTAWNALVTQWGEEMGVEYFTDEYLTGAQ